jgi:hypothetical protein
LQVFDLHSSAAAVRLSSFQPDRFVDIQAAQVAGTIAYLASYQRGLDVVDVSDPARPSSLGSYAISITAGAVRLQVVGQRLYLAQEQGLSIFDISTPAEPKLLGSYAPPLGAYDLQVAGDYAFLAGGNGGLLIVDVRTPADPKLLKQFDTQNTVFGVSVVGQRAYLANGSGGLLILDVTNPAAPAPLGSLPMAGFAGRIRVVNNVAYLGVSDTLQIIDVGKPATPVVRGSAEMSVNPSDIQVEGNYVYTTINPGGLTVHWFAPATTAQIGVGGGVLSSSVDATSYAFPAGTFTTAISATHTPRYSANLPSTGLLTTIEHAFELTIEGTAQAPAKPYSIQVVYSDAERGPAIESTLALYVWNGSTWSKLPTSAVNAAANKVTATTTQVGLFAVLSQTRRVYLSRIQR